MAKFSKSAVIAELESQIESLEQAVIKEKQEFAEKMAKYKADCKDWRERVVAAIKAYDPDKDDWWSFRNDHAPPSAPRLSNTAENGIAQRRQEIRRLGMISDETIDLKVKDTLWRFI